MTHRITTARAYFFIILMMNSVSVYAQLGAAHWWEPDISPGSDAYWNSNEPIYAFIYSLSLFIFPYFPAAREAKGRDGDYVGYMYWKWWFIFLFGSMLGFSFDLSSGLYLILINIALLIYGLCRDIKPPPIIEEVPTSKSNLPPKRAAKSIANTALIKSNQTSKKVAEKAQSSIGPIIIVAIAVVVFIWIAQVPSQPKVASNVSRGMINLQNQDAINNVSLPAVAVAPALDSIPNPMLDEWVRNNPWFDTDVSMREIALAIHDQLLQEGVDPDSSEYFARIDSGMRDVFPDKFGLPEDALNDSDISAISVSFLIPQNRDILRDQVKELDWNAWAQTVLEFEASGDLVASSMKLETFLTTPTTITEPLYTFSSPSTLEMESLQRWFTANQSLYLMMHNVSSVTIVGADLGHSFLTCENYTEAQRVFRVIFHEPLDPKRTKLFKAALPFYSIFADDDSDCLKIERVHAKN